MATDPAQITSPVEQPKVNGAAERYEEDKKQLVQSCSNCKIAKVSVREGDSSTSVILELFSGEKRVEYFIHSTPDYPRNTVVTSPPNDTIQCYNVPLIHIFNTITREWCKIHEIPLSELPSELLTSPPPTAPPTTVDQQISITSSVGSSEMYSDEDNDYFDYEEEPFADEDDMHELLDHDLAAIANIHGKNALEYRLHAGINEIDVLMYIDMAFLDEHTASAWGINLEEPVIIQLHFQSASEYLDGPEPKVEVFQAPRDSKEKRRKFGLGIQIQHVLEVFISNQWKMLSNAQLKRHFEGISKAASKPKKASTTPTSTPPTVSKSALQKLTDMGFAKSAAQHAVELCGEYVEKAVHLLTTGEMDSPSMERRGLEENTSPPYKMSRQDSQGARAELNMLVEDDDLKKVKQVPSLDDGFLAQMMQYLLNRIPSLNEFCVICDERHVLATGLIRPCVCTRELCVFAFQTLGVMADAAESVATDANVVDLLVAMCNSAANSSRAHMILDPYPSIVDPHNARTLAMDPSKKNYDEVKAVMKAIITGREELVKGRCNHMSLKSVLDTHHRLAFPLMQWIVATNRAYIVMLPEERRIQSMKTKYQFLLISSPPAKEAAFQKAKAKDGSAFAFHGSSIENWHSIMRKGLINASGTALQVNGAAYGSGIYLSPLSSTSFGYSTRYYYSSEPAKKEDPNTPLAARHKLVCMALCEVVTSKNLRRSDNIWVCPNADHVVTRFFFVYSNTHTMEMSLDTRKSKFHQEIMHAIQLSTKLKR